MLAIKERSLRGPSQAHRARRGLFYLITFAASIPAVFLLAPVLNHPGYIVSPGADTRVLWGCFLDLVNALACIGTAVALFPVVRRQNEAFALGLVTSRMLEAAIIVVGLGPRRRTRNRHGLPGHHGPGAGRGPRLDLPARARAHARHQRRAAGLFDVPIWP